MPKNVKFQAKESPFVESRPDTMSALRPPNRLPPLKQQPTLIDTLYKEKLIEEINLQNKQTKLKKESHRKVSGNISFRMIKPIRPIHG